MGIDNVPGLLTTSIQTIFPHVAFPPHFRHLQNLKTKQWLQKMASEQSYKALTSPN
jgi:hypothetical protein